MTLDQFQVDAFENGPFTGNPAAVIVINEWLEEGIMQKIAQENNLSETAFVVDEGGTYHIRWFTPTTEVNLCGHATLASAFVFFEELGYAKESITFQSKSGPLIVKRLGENMQLDFPTDTLVEYGTSPILEKGLGRIPMEVLKGRDDLIAIFESQEDIEGMNPEFEVLRNMSGRGVLVTSQGSGEYDFVSRAFFPQSGINEDPATGSAHTSLTPLWSKRLGKDEMTACQLSQRRGYFKCKLNGDRTLIAGKARLFLKGQIFI